MVNALAIDVGSTSLRTALVDELGEVTATHQHGLHVTRPHAGEVELDPTEIAELALQLATATLHDGGEVQAIGVTNQRATTIIFDPATGDAVGPALSWQDLRTVIDCLVLQGEGIRLAPNQSATKAAWLVERSGRDAADLRFATIETWIAWHLTRGGAFVSDRSNACVNGLVSLDLHGWDERVLAATHLDGAMLPQLVDTMGSVGPALALPGAAAITALVGDQPASLFGQSCVTQGVKLTLGTGAMLDVVRGATAPTTMQRFESGCFPLVVRSRNGALTWGVEAIDFSAGGAIEWLVALGLIATPAESGEIAASVSSSEGVSFVPAFNGLGTPQWDFGARAGFMGLTRGTTRAHLVRAVIEGVAQRGADLIAAAEEELDATFDEVRVDGGASDNPLLIQCLADFSGRHVAVSQEREATTRGAGLMALVGAGTISLEDVARLWRPRYVAAPSLSEDERVTRRTSWARDVTRVQGTVPELSSVSF